MVSVARESLDGRVQPLDELGQAAGQLDVATLDVVERKRLREEPLVVLGHRNAEQDPVEPGPPGIGPDAPELEVPPVVGVEPPPHVGLPDPLLNAGQVVVGEAEPPPHGLAPGEVEHLVAVERAVARSSTSARTPMTGLV